MHERPLDQSAVWSCKIGYAVRHNLPSGSDQPMRQAVHDAFVRLTGEDEDFIFSGWAGELTEGELAVVEDREPVRELTTTGKREALLDALYVAWTIIANVGHKVGGWDAQDPEWVEAAERWRDESFHPLLDKYQHLHRGPATCPTCGSDSPTTMVTGTRAWERANGPIPKPLEIDHLCFNPRCIRVDHMEPVTHAENMRRAKARKTHCVHGHEYTPENTGLQVKTSGYVSRYCRQCMRHRKKAAYRAARRRVSE